MYAVFATISVSGKVIGGILGVFCFGFGILWNEFCEWRELMSLKLGDYPYIYKSLSIGKTQQNVATREV